MVGRKILAIAQISITDFTGLKYNLLLYGKQFFGQIGRSDWLIILQYEPLPWKRSDCVFFFSFAPGKLKVARNTKRKKMAI